MKQAFLFSILAICISCFSCDKEKNREQKYRRTLNGDWEWINSISGNNGETSSPMITNSPSNTGVNYGLRIRSSDKAFLYKNGEQIKRGKLESIEKIPTSYNNYHIITFDFDGEKVIFRENSESYSPDYMSGTGWPYNNSSNNFKKIK